MVESKPPRDINRRRQFFKLVDGEMIQQPPPSLPAKLPFREQTNPTVVSEEAVLRQLFAPQQPEVIDESGYVFDRDWSDKAMQLLDQPLPAAITKPSVPAPQIEEKKPLMVIPPEQLFKVSRENSSTKKGIKESVYFIQSGLNKVKLRVPEPEGYYYNICWDILSPNELDYTMALQWYTDLLDGLIMAGHEKKLDMPKKSVIRDNLTSAFVSYEGNVPPVTVSTLKTDAMKRAMQDKRSEIDYVNFSVKDANCPFLDFTLKLFYKVDGQISIKASRKKGMEVPVGWADLMLRDYYNPAISNLNPKIAEQLAIELNQLTVK